MLLSQSSNNNYNNNNNLALCQVFFGSVKVCSIYECVCVCVDFTCNLLLCFIACLIFIMIIIVGIT